MSTTATRKTSTTNRTRKAATAPAKAATKATSTRKAAPAKKAAKPKAEPKVKKSDIPEEDRDWTYLAEKDPTDLHEDFAKWIEDKTGIEVDLKTVQAVCVLRMVYQRSEANKKRATYRALPGEIVEQRSVHMIAAHQDAQKEIAKKTTQAKPAAKKAPAKAAATRTRKAPAKKA